MRAVASVTTAQRPGLAEDLVDILEAEPFEDGHSPLAALTIGEVGVCYEALIALTDSTARKSSGQYFTPDDAAHFMAGQSRTFPDGGWMDPCCGVGNLAWHLASVQNDPAEFVQGRLILVDSDRAALLSAVALIGADFLAQGDREGLRALHSRAVQRDFLSPAPLPQHDHVIVNPPYARAPMQPGLRTRATREFFAFFIERVATSARGFIAVTPASYLAAPKFQILRDVLDEANDEDRDRAALVLNSSIPYIWWRALDGGVPLPKGVLFGTPIPDCAADDATLAALARELQETEDMAAPG
ncbi:N-6 DNA methylase [Propioniferax innocua]|uniref:N-6 DNA methylase n=1 Tax=Propioniferax innocua TaxID=1753 RepID=A0A542ZC96_9ACTN|nr:N-6 DNA methylase [Propioniferax innocua]TQL57975.1 N-6 DNA methylase [Propioniferax innocua]